MLTLKIKWMRYEGGKAVDETTLFIPADEVAAHGQIDSLEQMKAWSSSDFKDYSIKSGNRDVNDDIMTSRIIAVVVKDEPTVWYLATQAWVLGPNGQTIERIAP